MLKTYYSITKKISSKTACISLKESTNVNLFWWKGDNNFGDEINPLLIEKICGKKVDECFDKSNANLLAIGSILNFANRHSIVWGSGLLKPNKLFKIAPSAIKSVRGHLTKKVLNNLGFPVSNVGDLGLIVPDFFKEENYNKFEKRKVGVIPHYIDKNCDFIKSISNDANVRVIDIQSSIDDVLSGILACDVIFSSSLHGVIIADAYGKEAHWIKLSNSVVGGNFKFHDYFSSVSRKTLEPILVGNQHTIEKLLSQRVNYDLKIDKSQIYDSNPFI